MARFAEELAGAGGVGAPLSLAARLRGLLLDELAYGSSELAKSHAGYGGHSVLVAFSGTAREVTVALPLDRDYRADIEDVDEREARIAAVAVSSLVEAAGLSGLPATGRADLRLRAGDLNGHLLLTLSADPPWEEERADIASVHFDIRFSQVDRLRIDALAVPSFLFTVSEPLELIGSPHPLHVAEVMSRLGAPPEDPVAVEALEDVLLATLHPPETTTRAHEDPDPARRTARRILQRLAGMGKWSGYHTAFEHLSKGFEGNDRAFASEIGERLLSAGLLGSKRSVGQRHVYLNPRRAADIWRLIEDGTIPPGLTLPRS